MISIHEFGALRLVDFVPSSKIVLLEDWEYLDRPWFGEAIQFSEWLRLDVDPDVLRSLAIAFSSFPPQATRRVIGRRTASPRRGRWARRWL